MIGGHFLTFETLHLTEWNRLVAHVTQRVGTNNDHTGVQKTLARMMIALAIQGPTKGTQGKLIYYVYSDE